MCSVMAGLTGLMGVMQYQQQQEQADAQAAMYNAQAEAAEQNAKIEQRKQEQIADNYAQQAKDLRSRRRLAEGAQRAQTGAAGLGFAGSALDILSSGYEAYQEDQLSLLTNQRNDNYNSRIAETNWINQANSQRTAAKNVKEQANNALLPTILGTAASIYGIEQPWKNGGGSTGGTSGGFTVSSDLGYNSVLTTKKAGSSIGGNGTNFFTQQPFFPKDKYSFNYKGW